LVTAIWTPLSALAHFADSGRTSREVREVPTSLAAVGEAAVAIECDTEMRSQRSDGRVLLRIGIGIGCGNDDNPEPAAIFATPAAASL
jgi:hypothetical protein